ncbi:dehydrogenase E1 component subunit alpha/beta [Azospirillum isscasi]|uniref:2-oxoglutarate dehydrogenase E1 component n=1 Tax=Azospirillum isscasi TaxID=3053926 RepID=A0ABU0WP15_9PROT|nr:alpha-ketoacid dehydrogenase subunit alpha/beta [Azospirillum isscasi]MDQ2105972.1 thiamine pyrophosphate-dependent enzyme [Azospirillum isscasi]
MGKKDGGTAAGIEQAYLIRAVEQRLLDLYREGLVRGTVHTCTGQEWIGVALGNALEPQDRLLSNHRGHGHFLGRTGDVAGLFAEVMGRATGVCRGMGGTQHLCRDGFLSNGILGGMAPVAGGMALAQKFEGAKGVTVVVLGDGAMAEGVIYETLNIASRFGLPLYIVCESNGIAQSTPVDNVLAGSLTARAEAFGIATRRSDTWDVATLLQDVQEAVAAVRDRSAPLFHVIETFRLNAHSKGDDDRPRAVLERYWERDPLTRLLAEGDPIAHACQDRVRAAVAAAEGAARRAPPAAVPEPVLAGTMLRPVTLRPWRPPAGRLVDAINAGLHRALAEDERVVLLGEDIEAPYGGAFKATRDLSHAFPGRVLNTPISEAALVGLGNGLALAGRRPVVEIMFGDFLTLGFDQLLNHAAKFRGMYGGRVKVPLVVRTPMGGRHGYGPTHSQSLEKHFLGIPDLDVVALHSRADAAALYARLPAEIDGPLLVIENKGAYREEGGTDLIRGFDYQETDERWPTLLIRPRGPADCTLFCYGGMLREAERAADILFEEDEILVEIVCPVALHPFNAAPLLDSVSRTRRLVTVEEGCAFAGMGSEIVAWLAEHGDVPFRCRRLGAASHPIPAAIEAEAALLPDAAAIRKAIQDVMQ